MKKYLYCGEDGAQAASDRLELVCNFEKWRQDVNLDGAIYVRIDELVPIVVAERERIIALLTAHGALGAAAIVQRDQPPEVSPPGSYREARGALAGDGEEGTP